jgi:predicted site-specific integrase-resolvase
MQKQSEKTTALYYRVANRQQDNLLFDNQIEVFLSYANKHKVIRVNDRVLNASFYQDFSVLSGTLHKGGAQE